MHLAIWKADLCVSVIRSADNLTYDQGFIMAVVENHGHKRLKSVIKALIERLKMLSGQEGGEALRFATDVSRSMLGTSLDPEGHASLDADQACDLSMRVGVFSSYSTS
jgi:hypothetical protein